MKTPSPSSSLSSTTSSTGPPRGSGGAGRALQKRLQLLAEWDRFLREGQAHGLWRKGRKVEALHGFESLLSTHAAASWVVWYVGQLRFELGRFDEAERAFRSVWNEPLAHLYLGRIYERMDRPAEALEAYVLFATAWRNADPELQPLIDEARQAITRLSGAED